MASIGIGFLGEPALADADRAGLRRPLAWRRRRRSRRDRLHPRHRAAHQRRRAGAEDAGDQPAPSGPRAASRGR